MSLKDKYNIDDAAWKALVKNALLIIFFPPALFILVAGGAWGIREDFSLVPMITVIWTLLYLPIVLTIRISLVRAKFRAFSLVIELFLIAMFFANLSLLFAYYFWGITGFWTQTLLMIAACIFLAGYYYAYWEKVWESHEIYNETVALDLENGRFDFLGHFDLSEDKVKKSKAKKYSNAELMDIGLKVIPVGVAIPMICSKLGDHTMTFIIIWGLGIPVSLGIIKGVMCVFYQFKKLDYYEKKIGKPIINGLLPKTRGRKKKQPDKAGLLE